MKIVTLSYEAENLREQFEKLKGEKERTLAPLLGTIADRFLSNLQKNFTDYNVTDFRNESNNYHGVGDPPSYESQEYYLVVDGKLIKMRFLQPDISCEEDEFCYITDSILFEGRKEEASKIFEKLKEFVGQQNLEKLILATKKKLKEEHCDLGSETYNFYFKRGENDS